MRHIFRLAILVAIASFGFVVASFPIERSYQSKAQLVQRVKRNAGSELFGETGTPVGSPQMMIIEDKSAFTGGTSSQGAMIVDEGYLDSHKIYPLQLKSVGYVAGIGRTVSLAVLVVSAMIVIYTRKRLRAVDRPHGLA